MEKIIGMRRSQVLTKGALPVEARPMIRNLEIYGDPQGSGTAYRGDWVFNRDAPLVSNARSAGEVLLWVGCSGAFHPDYQEVARAMAKILKAAQVSFGILGPQELCCGDPARRMGDEALFVDLARRNVSVLNHHHITRILALCPHCFNTLKNEYPRLGGHFEVVHAVEFILSLLEQRKIVLKYALSGKAAIQDPCYLGRVNKVYEPLRTIVQAFPGLECTELRRSREKGFCCGGGGGRMWLHENLGIRINQLRAQEISDAGVERVVTACPYCLTMLQDGVNSLGVERPPKVSDIVSMVASSIG
jgi:Fe-S oxidoreductase